VLFDPPPKAPRERILQAALDLFDERDSRFASKEEVLMAFDARLPEFGTDAAGVGAQPTTE
jgi:hypothetical protein